MLYSRNFVWDMCMERWQCWESIMKVKCCSGLYLFQMKVVILWNAHPLAWRTSQFFLEKCIHLFELGYVHFIFTKFSEEEFNLWPSQIYQVATRRDWDYFSTIWTQENYFFCDIFFTSIFLVFVPSRSCICFWMCTLSWLLSAFCLVADSCRWD